MIVHRTDECITSKHQILMFLFGICFFVARCKLLRTQPNLKMRDQDQIIFGGQSMGQINVQAK